MQVIESGAFSGMENAPQPELISVIVAVYNIEGYVERCVRSILEQTWRNLEILLVDDGSTDESGRICDRLAGEDERIRVIHKENGGLSDARNAGIAQMRGTLVAFVDGDDWIEPDMYERMAWCMKRYDAPLAVCRYRQIFRDHVLDGSTDRVVVLEGSEGLEEFIAENDEVPIRNAAWNKLYRRELMGELRFPAGKLYEDIVYTTKLLARAERCVYVDRAEYNYVLEREGSIMGRGLGERIFTDQIPAYREKEAFLKSLGRQELVYGHRYFFYKRLLQYYNQCRKSKEKRQRQYCGRLRALVLEGRDEMESVYGWERANPNEKRKMMVFLRSEALYGLMTDVNEGLVLPAKGMLRKLLRR